MSVMVSVQSPPESSPQSRVVEKVKWRFASLVTGLRLAFGYSWRALIGSELIAASSGLGYLIIDAQELQRTDVVMVGILVIGLIGWTMDWTFHRVVARTLGRRFPEVAA